MEPMLSPLSIEEINNAAPVEIELPEEPDLTIVEISLEINPDEKFKQNLAEDIPQNELQSLAAEITEDIRIDKNSRREWDKTVTDGMELLGMKLEDRTQPWNGACGVFHSLMSEAVIKFQSEMIMETFPANGPVQTKIIGKDSKDKQEAANRVKEDMNWQLTENMSEYRGEHERLLWNLGFCGSGFKKVYYDPSMERQIAMFVPAEDMYLPYGCTDVSCSPRVTQVMRKSENEVKKLIQAGFYMDVELGEASKEVGDIEKKKQKLSGMTSLDDNRHILYECHLELDLPGFEDEVDGEKTGIALPYVVTLDTNGNIFSIYRNWNPDDKTKAKREHFVQYTFIPGFGPYGFGYVHILGGYAKGATSVLRQLVDAGTLANLPGGLKARGLRIKGDDTPIAPGEFRDVDVPAGTIRDNIIPLPYKEPSNTLFLLFKEIVDEGRSLASTADMKVADMNQQAPVGTTLAIIERMMKVMSAVQARVHNSMKKEFKLLQIIIKDYTPEEYSYETERGRMVKQSDYEHCDIIPVSDPNASSSAQRMAQYQAALQLSGTAPQLYDLPELHREALRVLGMKNASKIVPDKDDIKAKDPVSENMNIMNGKPVKAFLYQDHDAHLAVHMSAAQDPSMQKIIGQNPMASILQQSLQAHLMEHMAFKYRIDIEKQMGVSLPKQDEELPEDIESQVSRLAAEAAPLVLQLHSQKAAQEAAIAQQQDPVIQAQQQDQQLKAAELQEKAKNNDAMMKLKLLDMTAKDQLAHDKIESAEKIAGMKAGQTVATADKQRQHEENLTGFKAGIELRKQQ